MFDLESAILSWRKEMLAAGIKKPQPLGELELHLREEIHQMIQAGVDQQAAFTSAVINLGPAPALQNEFKKVRTLKEARMWRQFGVLFLVFIWTYPLMAGSLAFYFKNGKFEAMTLTQDISCVAAACALTMFTYGVRWSCERFPVLLTNRVRDALFLSTMLWLLVLAYIIMPYSHFTEEQSGVVSLWGFSPFGILLGWILGKAADVHKQLA